MSSLPAVAHSDEGKSDELRAELARAAEQRTDSVQRESKAEELKRLAREHDIKQSFRRLLDPGIMRPNNREHAFEALKVNNKQPLILTIRIRILLCLLCILVLVDLGNDLRQPAA